MTARFLVGDVFDRLAELETGSVDLVITSPPFLALRSYLPVDHPDKAKEIGSESTPAAFLDVMLKVMAELRRVTAEHGSVCIELGDTYAGSGGGGGDYLENGWREGQQQFAGSAPASMRESNAAHWRQKNRNKSAWPDPKSKALIPELFRVALAYGINPLTGTESPAGKWLVRNVVTWCRPNPPVGALGDKWRPATSDVVVACTSPKRYWDDLATRRPHSPNTHRRNARAVSARENTTPSGQRDGNWDTLAITDEKNPAGAPLLDYWEIPPTGYSGSHYAVYPPALVEPLVKAMCPPKVCRTCGEPSRRIVSTEYEADPERPGPYGRTGGGRQDLTGMNQRGINAPDARQLLRIDSTLGWSECGHGSICSTCDGTGHIIDQPPGTPLNEADLVTYKPCPDCVNGKRIDNWRPGLILDPFAGSGTTLLVATGHGHDAIGIDLDERNADLALERVGPFLLEVVA